MFAESYFFSYLNFKRCSKFAYYDLLMVKRKNNELSPRQNTSKRPTRSDMSNCKVCLEPIDFTSNDEELFTLTCRECKARFHGNCVGISSNFFYNLIRNARKGWACFTCIQNKMQFVENISERVQTIENTINVNSNKISNVQASVDAALVAMNEKIDEVRKSLHSEIQELKEREISDALTLNSGVQRQSSSQPSSEDLSFIRSLQRKNNLIIQNIPLFTGENAQTLKSIVVKIAACFGYVLEPPNILVVIRLRNKNPQTNRQNTNERPLSNSLLVKLSDVTVKDDFFNSYISNVIQKKFITGTAIGISSNQRVYINHHLSPELSQIKMRASEMKKAGIISKINARYDCVRVFVNDTWHRVTDVQGLSQLAPMDQ